MELVAQFSINVLNQNAAGVDGIARTTNTVEGWRHGLQSLVQCHHPALWTFLSGIKRDMHFNFTNFLNTFINLTSLHNI